MALLEIVIAGGGTAGMKACVNGPAGHGIDFPPVEVRP